VLARQGDVTEAAREYRRAVDQILRQGPTNGAVTTYYTREVFRRDGISDDLLPGIVWITITDKEEPRMWQLAEWYEELGRYKDAARTYRELAEAVPDRPEATRRANVLLAETGPLWRW
jgi:tetratricopeptide (TPR) repeat protein